MRLTGTQVGTKSDGQVADARMSSLMQALVLLSRLFLVPGPPFFSPGFGWCALSHTAEEGVGFPGLGQ